MAQPFNAMIRVVKTSSTGEIASVSPEKFLKVDIDNIANVTNQIVINLQNNLKANDEVESTNHLGLSEVEMTFGVDIGVEGKTEVRFPIIGPLIGGGAKAGATFEVHIKLSRGSSPS
jgi:hypothetical protein